MTTDSKRSSHWFSKLQTLGQKLVSDLPLPLIDRTNISKWNFGEIIKVPSKLELPLMSEVKELPEQVKSLISTNDSDARNLFVQISKNSFFAELTPEAKDNGVIFTSIMTAVLQHSELVKKYYLSDDGLKIDSHKLVALNTALLNGGVFLYVPKNVAITEVFQAYFVPNSSSDSDIKIYNHVIIVLEDNAQINYSEHFLASDTRKTGTANLIAEAYVGKNAKLKFSAVDNLPAAVTTYACRYGYIFDDGSLCWVLAHFNSGNTISENITWLKGTNSESTSKSLTIGAGEQIGNFTTKMVHIGKASKGEITKRGVITDTANVIFNGIGHILHGAKKASADQTSKLLMLNKAAKGQANPILLIDEDDVAAGHAASAGRVDELELYYLMSRGIAQKEAEKLIIKGFLAPLVEDITPYLLQNKLINMIEQKLT